MEEGFSFFLKEDGTYDTMMMYDDIWILVYGNIKIYICIQYHLINPHLSITIFMTNYL